MWHDLVMDVGVKDISIDPTSISGWVVVTAFVYAILRGHLIPSKWVEREREKDNADKEEWKEIAHLAAAGRKESDAQALKMLSELSAIVAFFRTMADVARKNQTGGGSS